MLLIAINYCLSANPMNAPINDGDEEIEIVESNNGTDTGDNRSLPPLEVYYNHDSGYLTVIYYGAAEGTVNLVALAGQVIETQNIAGAGAYRLTVPERALPAYVYIEMDGCVWFGMIDLRML